MANRISRTQPMIFKTWWGRTLVGFVSLLAAYGFASLAIDSGNLLHYAITIALLWWAIHNFMKAVVMARAH